MSRKKRFDDNLQYLVYGVSAKNFEERLLILSTLFMSLFNFVYVFANLLMGLNILIVVATILGSVVFFILYLVLRRKSRPKIMHFVVSILMLLFIDFSWLVNYGSNGPVFQFFIVLLLFIILLFHRKYYLYFTLVLVVNALVLFGLEYFQRGIVGAYPNEQSRMFDNYIGFFFCVPIVLSFLSAIKKKYIYEHERAQKSDQLKSAFLANVSHEIRTPLNAIVGFSALMAESDVTNEDKQMFCGHVLHNSEHLLNLIDDIVDVSKIESNQMEVKIRDVNVVPLIGMVVQTFQSSGLAGSEVEIQDTLQFPKLILKVDKVRFEQVLRNLISNAVKFTDKGIIQVGGRKDKDFYTFWVKDTGIGISHEHQKIIFDRFIKIDSSKQHLYRGTGIGLFLSKVLVEMMGGRIWVESVLGKGSTFYFTIPL